MTLRSDQHPDGTTTSTQRTSVARQAITPELRRWII